MRIIAGSARRVQLEVAERSTARPFLEMARGALFNSLGGRVEGAVVLDLFAGSGALGLEALSRGAASCVFVERDAASVAALLRNIDKCGMTGVARVARQDVFRMAAADAGGYDLIFIDPPFAGLDAWRAGGAAEDGMRSIGRLLTTGGLAVFRLEDGKHKPPEWPGLELLGDKRYGRSRVCRYGKAKATATEDAT